MKTLNEISSAIQAKGGRIAKQTLYQILSGYKPEQEIEGRKFYSDSDALEIIRLYVYKGRQHEMFD